MSRIISTAVIILFLFSAMISMHCGSALSDPMAGGTGTGNPGGSTTVSILVDSSGALGKTVASPLPQAGPADSLKRQFQISDASGMPMQVTSAVIGVRLVTFTLDTGENPLLLLQRFNQPLQQDSGDIALPGPYTFDAMTGLCDPAIDTLRLPEARYTGVKLSLDTQLTSGPGGRIAAFELGGTFDYLGVTRTFTIRLNINAPLPYVLQTGTFAVSQADTTHLTVVFNPQQWLAGIDIKTCLDSGQLQLDAGGNLVIDGNPGGGGGPCQSIEGTIRGNVISSGRLRVQQ